MKRFYTDVTVATADDGFHAILLDGKPVRTPARAALTLPTPALAAAVAEEWAAQAEEISPATMPLTGLANAAIDLVLPDPAKFALPILPYAETDMLAYRSDDSALARAQIAEWNPLLDAAELRWGVQFALTQGVMHIAQPAATIAALAEAVLALDPWRLAALAPLTTIGGSLVIALDVIAGRSDAAAGWQAVTLEERFQEERWGADADAVAARANKEREWHAAARFAALLSAA